MGNETTYPGKFRDLMHFVKKKLGDRARDEDLRDFIKRSDNAVTPRISPKFLDRLEKLASSDWEREEATAKGYEKRTLAQRQEPVAVMGERLEERRMRGLPYRRGRDIIRMEETPSGEVVEQKYRRERVRTPSGKTRTITRDRKTGRFAKKLSVAK